MDPTIAAIDQALLGLRHLWGQSGTFSDPELGPLELSTVLVAHEVGRSGTEVSVADVAAGLDVTHSTASRLVDRAVRSGVITRSASQVDSRRTQLALTPAGQRLNAEAARFRAHYLASVLPDWSDRKRQQFAKQLTEFTQAIRNQPPRGDHE